MDGRIRVDLVGIRRRCGLCGLLCRRRLLCRRDRGAHIVATDLRDLIDGHIRGELVGIQRRSGLLRRRGGGARIAVTLRDLIDGHIRGDLVGSRGVHIEVADLHDRGQALVGVDHIQEARAGIAAVRFLHIGDRAARYQDRTAVQKLLHHQIAAIGGTNIVFNIEVLLTVIEGGTVIGSLGDQIVLGGGVHLVLYRKAGEIEVVPGALAVVPAAKGDIRLLHQQPEGHLTIDAIHGGRVLGKQVHVGLIHHAVAVDVAGSHVLIAEVVLGGGIGLIDTDVVDDRIQITGSGHDQHVDPHTADVVGRKLILAVGGSSELRTDQGQLLVRAGGQSVEALAVGGRSAVGRIDLDQRIRPGGGLHHGLEAHGIALLIELDLRGSILDVGGAGGALDPELEFGVVAQGIAVDRDIVDADLALVLFLYPDHELILAVEAGIQVHQLGQDVVAADGLDGTHSLALVVGGHHMAYVGLRVNLVDLQGSRGGRLGRDLHLAGEGVHEHGVVVVTGFKFIRMRVVDGRILVRARIAGRPDQRIITGIALVIRVLQGVVGRVVAVIADTLPQEPVAVVALTRIAGLDVLVIAACLVVVDPDLLQRAGVLADDLDDIGTVILILALSPGSCPRRRFCRRRP